MGDVTTAFFSQHLQKFQLVLAVFLTAVGIAMHNFPEGMAVLFSSLSSHYMGFSVAVAIAIHNVPEGVAVSIPIFYATGSRKKAFVYSFFAGLTEPLGAIAGYFFLFQFLTRETLFLMLAAVVGVMVFIYFDELLPISIKYGSEHLTFFGSIFGNGCYLPEPLSYVLRFLRHFILIANNSNPKTVFYVFYP